MKVICIDNKNLENQLTINRVYEVDDMTCHDVGDFVFGILKSNLAQGKEEFSVISNTGGGKNFWRFQIRYDAGMNPVSIKSARINIS